MRSVCFLLLLAAPASAQQQSSTPTSSTSTTYIVDLNGRQSPYGTTTTRTGNGMSTHSEITQSINGRTVPLQTTEEKVIREDANGRVVERIVHRYDANGNEGPIEKQQIEERKNPDGSVSGTVTVYRADVNGSMQLAERVRTDSQRSGATTNATVLVERPTLNGTVDLVERQTVVETKIEGGSKSSLTTYRKDTSGTFVETLRQTADATGSNGQRTENKAQYELGDGGKLKLHGQTVTHARKNADGTESREVDIYRAVPGRADPQVRPALEERQIIEQRRTGDQLREITTVQRPTVSDPNHLGAPLKLSERICSGSNCN